MNDLLSELRKNDVRIYAVPYLEMLKEIGKEVGEEQLSKLTRMINVLTLGVSFGLVNYDKKNVEKGRIQDRFPPDTHASPAAERIHNESAGKGFK